MLYWIVWEGVRCLEECRRVEECRRLEDCGLKVLLGKKNNNDCTLIFCMIDYKEWA